jgi:DNA-directed RNA polymerase subunit RPC12/RpoP
MAKITCGECSWPVPAESWNREEGIRCPVCGERIQAIVFPAIAGARTGALPETVLSDTEASCFYHPESRAVVPCDECGRFLCSLCEIEIDGRKLCPACFQSGLASNRLEAAETRRTMYDTVALALATLPFIVMWPAVIVSAPAALFTVVRRWRAPGSIVPRTRIRFYLAVLFALGELTFAAILFYAVFVGIRMARKA